MKLKKKGTSAEKLVIDTASLQTQNIHFRFLIQIQELILKVPKGKANYKIFPLLGIEKEINQVKHLL